MTEPPTAVALSGGGHRACLFALGVLLRLADVGRHSHVTSIASVSGGSLANGAIAATMDYGSAEPAAVRALVARTGRRIAAGPVRLAGPVRRVFTALAVLLVFAALMGPWQLETGDATRIALAAAGLVVAGVVLRVGVTGGGTVFGWWGTWAYLLAVAATAEALLVGVARLDASDATTTALYAASALVLSGLLGLRGRVAARAFAHTLFPRRARTKLADIGDTLDHVMCATELHAGEHVYFSSRFVGAYRFGHGTPNGLRLHTAVQASAAFPGAFPVTWVRRSRFGFTDPAEPKAARVPTLALVDGGVYDNMGDQWAQGLEDRAQRWPAVPLRKADELVVVSASAGLAFGSVWMLRIPLLGALLALLRDKSVLYDNGNSVRRKGLVARFELAERERRGLRGVLVHIEQSPFTVPDVYARAEALWPERARRARAAQEWLLAPGAAEDAVRDGWRDTARANALVPTTLVGLHRDVSARLLHHAYILAAVNLHVILGHPLSGSAPSLDEFAALL